jgi:CHAT domain-containing protein
VNLNASVTRTLALLALLACTDTSYASESEYDQAVHALSAAHSMGTPHPLWRANFALATSLQDRGDAALAIFFGKEAIAQLERLRGHLTEAHSGLESASRPYKLDVYREVANWLMAAGRIDEGLQVLRLLKAEELYDFMLRDAQWSRETGIEFTADESAVRGRYLALLDAAPEDTRADRIRQFVTSTPLDNAGPRLRAIHTERVAYELERFRPGSALAFFLVTETKLRVLIATRRGQYEYVLPVDVATLRGEIASLLEAIARREDVTARAQRLYTAIAKPLDEEARRAGARRLVLWLDGSLRYVPFGVLNDGKHYLLDRYAIETYVPRDPRLESRVGITMPRPKPAPVTVLGLGLTRAVGGYAALPAMADELCDVVNGPIEGLELRGRSCPRDQYGNGALEGAGFADGEFTAPRLHDLLGEERDFSVLHLGTRCSLHPGNARSSFVVLGDGSHLTLDAIAGLDFHNLRVVTLSGCQSGFGGATSDDGREIEGLSAIVQRRGARHVVASLWRVDNRSTARLMRELYAGQPKERGDTAAALRLSQLHLRAVRENGGQPYEHPYFWGGFHVSTN